MNIEQIIFVGVLLVVFGALIIKNPWKDMDLTSREETDDSVKSPAHVDPVIKEAVTKVVKDSRKTVRKVNVVKPAPVCGLEDVETATTDNSAVSATPKRRAVRRTPIL